MKKILSLVSVLTIGVAPILTLNATSLYDVKNNFEGTDFKANLESSQQAKKIVKRETEIHQKKSNFVKDSELATPITKVTAFYINNSDKNTFIWSKKLPTGTKYNFFKVEVKENSNYWVEGYEFNYFNRRVYSPLGYVVNMPLINNKEDEKTLAEETYSSYVWGNKSWRKIDVVNVKLILNLQYSDNVITAKFTAKATVKNTSLFSWVKTQAKFYFKIIVS